MDTYPAITVAQPDAVKPIFEDQGIYLWFLTSEDQIHDRSPFTRLLTSYT